MPHVPLKKKFQCPNKNGSQKNFKKINMLKFLKYLNASPKNQVLKSKKLSLCETAYPARSGEVPRGLARSREIWRGLARSSEVWRGFLSWVLERWKLFFSLLSPSAWHSVARSDICCVRYSGIKWECRKLE